MASAKEQVMAVLARLPDDCTVEDVLYELYVLDRVEQGMQAVEEGRVVSHDEAMARLLGRMERWRDSSGPKPHSPTSN